MEWKLEHDHCLLLQDQEAAGQGNTDIACQSQQLADNQPEPEQRKPKQRQHFLEPGSGDESEPHQAVPTAEQGLTADQQPSRLQQGQTAKQSKAAKARDQQASRGRKRADGKLVEESLPDDDGVPSTYNNMPSRRQQQRKHDDYANENAAPQAGEFHEQLKAGRNKSQKLQQKEEVPAQVTGADLEFDASDAQSDEYEPTQAKAAAKRAGQKALQPKGLTGKTQRSHQDKQQGNAKQPRKVAKHSTEEGQAKRPRGRPRKAPPQHEQQPMRARKRKDMNAFDEEDPDKEQDGKAVPKPKKGKTSRLQKVALMPETEEAVGQDAQVRLKICLLAIGCLTAMVC